jgi:Tol biopolymer transport system component
VEHTPVRAVTIEPALITLAWNEARQVLAIPRDAEGEPLDDRAVAWVIGNPSIAEVDETGRVTAKSNGTTVLTATSEGVTAHAEVAVLPAPVNRVVLSVAELALEAGEARTVTVRLEDRLGRELTDRRVTWASSNQIKIFVTDEGKVYALDVGSATITATSEGKSAELQVVAMPRPAFDLIYDRPLGMEGAEIFLLGLGRPSIPLKLNAGNVSRDPSPSPDGTRFVFAVTQRDLTTGLWQNDLYVVDRTGMNMRWLTRTGGIEEQPAWSPDGTRIAFSAMDPTNGEVDIWVINVDEPGLYNLTRSLGSQRNDHAPAWSPDGTRIAFATTGVAPHGRIWIMNANGTAHAPLNEDAGVDNYPTWSPSGEYIAFQRSGVGVTGTDIMTVRVSGGTTTRLALPGEQYTPSWSPDGAYIAFTNQIGGTASQIYTMRPDGTGVRLRTTEAAWGGGRNPSWITRP